MADDLYRVLKVSPAAGPEEIRRAYLALARAHHPDVNNSADANERFKAINAAYEVLGDPVRRAQYDAARNAEAEARQTRPQPPGSEPFRPPRPDPWPPPISPEPRSRWLSFRRIWIGGLVLIWVARLAGSFLGSDAVPATATFRPPTPWVLAPPSATAPKPTQSSLDDLDSPETIRSAGSG